jgi:hypothetical protein
MIQVPRPMFELMFVRSMSVQPTFVPSMFVQSTFVPSMFVQPMFESMSAELLLCAKVSKTPPDMSKLSGPGASLIASIASQEEQ